MTDAKWFEGLRPDELPEGDIRLVAEQCGMDVALSLAEHMGGVQLYVRNIGSLISRKKEQYILRNFDGQNHKDLAIATGYTERWVYQVLKRARGEQKEGVFGEG